VRLVGGRLKGRVLVTPAGHSTRPTSDRARQAIFNILDHAAWSDGLTGRRVLDAFAGSGALGLEALSRGADTCLFIETDEVARGCIRQNIEKLDLFGCTRVHRQSATDPGQRSGPKDDAFDLVFLDPPYGLSLGEQAVSALNSCGWLAPNALIVLEKGSGEPPPVIPGFSLIESRRYGAACIHFLRPEQDQ
jgi:16S rRNA (guanine966-N2)-methyltransferase